VSLRDETIQFSDSGPFDAAELIDAAACGRGLAEAQLKHVADHSESKLRVKRQAGLVEQTV